MKKKIKPSHKATKPIAAAKAVKRSDSPPAPSKPSTLTRPSTDNSKKVSKESGLIPGRIKQAEFATSASDPSGYPQDGLPQIAVFGRSNVGKSSLLNALMGRRDLVKTSSTPGKTRLINFFKVNRAFYLVDVPGFGYTKVGTAGRRTMEKVIKDYVDKEPAFVAALFLVDSRIPNSRIDHDALNWLSDSGKPLLVIATKADKVSKNDLQKSLAEIRAQHGLDDEPLPVSAHAKAGLNTVWEQIDMLIAAPEAPITSA